jgi:hypothetical protein
MNSKAGAERARRERATWQTCNTEVHLLLMNDWLLNCQRDVPPILAGWRARGVLQRRPRFHLQLDGHARHAARTRSGRARASYTGGADQAAVVGHVEDVADVGGLARLCHGGQQLASRADDDAQGGVDV